MSKRIEDAVEEELAARVRLREQLYDSGVKEADLLIDRLLDYLKARSLHDYERRRG